jgi:hypothetical protein
MEWYSHLWFPHSLGLSQQSASVPSWVEMLCVRPEGEPNVFDGIVKGDEFSFRYQYPHDWMFAASWQDLIARTWPQFGESKSRINAPAKNAKFNHVYLLSSRYFVNKEFLSSWLICYRWMVGIKDHQQGISFHLPNRMTIRTSFKWLKSWVFLQEKWMNWNCQNLARTHFNVRPQNRQQKDILILDAFNEKCETMWGRCYDRGKSNFEMEISRSVVDCPRQCLAITLKSLILDSDLYPLSD